MMHELCEGLAIDLDDMTLQLDLAAFKPPAGRRLLVWDLMPALEDAYAKYVTCDPTEDDSQDYSEEQQWHTSQQ